MSSKTTDLADRRQKQRQVDANLAEARAGKSRLRDMADQKLEPSHGERSKDTPNTFPGGGR
jgi:hypothetical protein